MSKKENSKADSVPNGEVEPEEKENGEKSSDAKKIAFIGDVAENAPSSSFSTDGESSTPSQRLLPIVSLQHGLRRKATALEVQSWVMLLLTLDGRDKITKALQYSSRLLAYWLVGTTQAKRFQALKASLTTSRKAFRLGRSIIELQKLRAAGLIERLGWNLQQNFPESEGEDAPQPKSSYARRRHFERRVSSNIGWGPVTMEESTPSRRLYRSMSSVAYRMYRPLASRLSMSGESSAEPTEPLWKVVGSALKMVGLLGFWTGDNVSFLASSGLFDDYGADDQTRMAQRKQLATRASLFANRFYFLGAVSGLLVSLRSYLEHRYKTLKPLQKNLEEAEAADDEDEEEAAERALDKAKERQFVLFLALLKSCCDVLVFSNNPGIDLWKKRTGHKMNETFHCICGLTSASTVLYNNFPNATK